MSFRDQANYMFPISASVILVSFLFAFWAYPRTVLWSSYKYIETWFIVKFGIYELFLWFKECKQDLTTSGSILKKLEKSVEKMKGDVKKRYRESRQAKKAKEAAETGPLQNKDQCRRPDIGSIGDDSSHSISSTEAGKQGRIHRRIIL
ncbi:uncharacterized protein ColSpa_04720 [Colletotrichum spaethianum]|uniref:Uncharacterized protein n=1 Tax=Colletotrichum spaethianum TaxID=700344 RepID=A0AA37P7L5_9PEZI|nr:uncharacterized protein ColSpa_04720 [Colletotrichum spaethianum]GKT44539.1 hypothetical protein ColSpa_04720 [Colletotrichum spaethianum]